MKVLITGLCGFIGHHVADVLLEHTDWQLIGLDRIDATSTYHRMRYVKDWETKGKRVRFVWHDLRAPLNAMVMRQIGDVDVVLHMAASTHVDRSIEEPLGFVYDNVLGTAHILDAARQMKLGLFLYFGTDEIFGPAPAGTNYKEWDRYNSGNPYAATKAGGEELALAFSNTYGIPVVCTHTMNVIGERQHPEKFLPSTIRKIRDGEEVIIHADKTRTKSGSRFYLHARNVGHALQWVIDHRSLVAPLKKINIVGEREVSNFDLAELVAVIQEKPLRHKMVDFHSSRPGHDLRYALDGSVLKNMGFEYPRSLEQSVAATVRWSLDHPEWLTP